MKCPVPSRTKPYPRNTNESEQRMPTSYPFPTIARLALSLYASARKIERLPVVRVFEPSQIVEIAPRPFGQMFGGLCPPAHGWESL